MATDLPEREAMSTVGHGFGHGLGNVAIPINEATAQNISIDSSMAVADADQIVNLNQTSTGG